METTLTRLKRLRKNFLRMSQEEFGSKLNLSKSNISNIEVGRVELTDRNINSICEVFNVNEVWLRTGEGGDDNMFIKPTPYEKAYNRFGYIMENSPPAKKAALTMLLEILYEVPDDKWEMIMKEFEEIRKEG